MLLDLAQSLPEWEKQEDGSFEKPVDANGWYATAQFVNYGDGAFQMIIETNITFPKEAHPNIGLSFAMAHGFSYGTFMLATQQPVLAARMLLCIGEKITSQDIADTAESAYDALTTELTTLIPLLLKVAHGGLSSHEALAVLSNDREGVYLEQ